VYTEAPRGRILDRNGQILVDNRIVPTVVVDRDITKRHPESLDRLAAYLTAGNPAGAVTVMDLQRKLADPRFSQYKPVPVAEDIPKEKVVFLREHQADFPGVNVVQLTQRYYPHKQLAAHVLGYVGEIDEKELASRKAQGYRAGDSFGKSGVELAYEAELRGVPQVEKLQVDSQDRVLRSLGIQPAVPGRDVVLTLDLNVQTLAEDALKQALDSAHGAWDPDRLKRFIAPAGSVVVEDPRDGAILAMASFPTYDPSEFVNGISVARFQQLQDPASSYPLNNRAIQGEYAPGSTFKMVTSLAALGREVIAPGSTINDTGSFSVGNPPTVFRNAFGLSHGPVNLNKALTVSSDVYFYQLGEKLDTPRKPYPIQDMARSLGFGKETGIELPFEATGRVPDPDVKKRLHDANPDAFPEGTWYTGDSINLSVGQGDLVVTPMQLTNAYAAFANGGTVWAPRLGGAVRDPVRNASVPIEPHQIAKAELRPADREAVLQGLAGVVASTDGTAAPVFVGFPLNTFQVAGKTGTAEVAGKQETALFVGFGPVDAPRYVVTAVLEEAGLGSQAAAPVVRQIFDGLTGNPLRPITRGTGRD
jgi:penicillin-binding protein 2